MVDTPNTDPLLDPCFASSEARRLFPQQLEATADLIEYGKLLIKRLTGVAVKEVDDLVIVCALLRQVVLSLDAWHLLVSNGAVQAGRPHIRGAFEASFYIEWTFGSGKQRWARQLYVSSLRRLRIGDRRVVPGSPEYAEFSSAWQARWRQPYSPSTEATKSAVAEEASITTLLNSPAYAAINAAVDAAAARYEPHWYSVGANGVRSISAMATALNRRAEYLGIYGPLSTATHGWDPGLHLRLDEERGLSIEPSRSPVSLGADVILVVGMVLAVYRRLLEQYRPEEIPAFNQRYLEKWRDAFLNPPEVVETSDAVWI